MSTNKLFPCFILPAVLAALFVLPACSKKNQHRISGRYIDDMTKKGIGGEKFDIMETVDRGYFKDKRTLVKSTTTDDDGYFDFGNLNLQKRSGNRFTVGIASSDLYTDIFKIIAIAPIEFSEKENYYNFYVVPAFRNFYVNLAAVSNVGPGDSLSYTMESEYLKQTNSLDDFRVEGSTGITSFPFSILHYKGPIGRYFVTVRRKINNVVTYSRDTILLKKGDFTYDINL